MKYRIEISGSGRTVKIGRIPEEVGNYIKENFDNDVEKYLDSVKTSDVPKEFLIEPEWDEKIKKNALDDDDILYDLNQCDEIYYEDNLLIDCTRLWVKNENGDVIFRLKCDHLEGEYDWASDLDGYEFDGVQFKFENTDIMLQENDMLLFHVIPFDGGYHAEIETDDEFDPEKLCLVVSDFGVNQSVYNEICWDYPNLESDIIRGYFQNKIYYDNNEIELESEPWCQLESDHYYSFRVPHDE